MYKEQAPPRGIATWATTREQHLPRQTKAATLKIEGRRCNWRPVVFPHRSQRDHALICSRCPRPPAPLQARLFASTCAFCACVELAENGVIHCLPWGAPRSTVDTRNKKYTFALWPCTPPPTLETLRERMVCQLVPA